MHGQTIHMDSGHGCACACLQRCMLFHSTLLHQIANSLTVDDAKSMTVSLRPSLGGLLVAGMGACFFCPSFLCAEALACFEAFELGIAIVDAATANRTNAPINNLGFRFIVC